jgi:hypothetical protein
MSNRPEQRERLPEFALFPTKAGDKSRVLITPDVYDTLQKAEIGSALLLVPVPSEQRDKIEANGKRAPTHRIVVMPKGDAPANFKPKATTSFKKSSRPNADADEL